MFEKLKKAIGVLSGSLQAIDSALVWPPIRVQTVYKVVEIKAPRISQAWTKEIKDTVGTLSSHPGFIAITDRLNLQRQMLENKCSHEFHKDLREADYLQAGVFWLGYVQDLVAKATKLAPSAPVDPFDEEMAAFKEIDRQIERIGMEQPQAAEQN
jgi:hypothetical protein